MMRERLAAAGLAATLLAVALPTREAGAIPAFARKYRTSCSTCHVAFPKLNDFGEAFRLNGFQIRRDDELFVKDVPVSLGAEAWKLAWPDAIWPGDLPNLPPVAFLARFQSTSREGDPAKGSLEAPESFVILAGGTFGRDISFFVHYGVEPRIYVQFTSLFEGVLPPQALSLRVGLFEPSLFPYSNARRLTATPMLPSVFNLRLPSGNGNEVQLDRQTGIELEGLVGPSLRWTLGAVNGTGDGGDTNSSQDAYVRVAKKMGGMGFDGSGGAVEGEDLRQTDNWADNSLTLGAFGYLGRSTAFDVTSTSFEEYDIRFHRLGLDLRANWYRLDLFGGVLLGRDRDPGNDGGNVLSAVRYLEADYVLFPWLIGVGRFEQLDWKRPGTNELEDEEVKRAVVALAVLIRANLKLAVEVQPNFAGESKDVVLFRLEFAF